MHSQALKIADKNVCLNYLYSLQIYDISNYIESYVCNECAGSSHTPLAWLYAHQKNVAETMMKIFLTQRGLWAQNGAHMWWLTLQNQF